MDTAQSVSQQSLIFDISLTTFDQFRTFRPIKTQELWKPTIARQGRKIHLNVFWSKMDDENLITQEIKHVKELRILKV